MSWTNQINLKQYSSEENPTLSDLVSLQVTNLWKWEEPFILELNAKKMWKDRQAYV